MVRLFLINMITLLTHEQAGYIIVGVLAIVLIIALFILLLYKRVFSKRKYKEATYIKLNRLARNKDYLLLNNYKVDFDDNHVGYIDHLLISKKYIFAINDFSLSGVITGELKGRSLTVVDGKNEVKQINNPLNYNINLVKRFNLYNNLDQSFVKGVVVVNDDSLIKIENSTNQFFMIQRKKIARVIKKFDKDNEKNFSEETIVKFINKLSKENKW